MRPRRWIEGDRPALTFKLGDKTSEILQQVGFYDEIGAPVQYALAYVLEKGWVKEGEIKRQKVPLDVFARQELNRFRQSLTKQS